MKKILIKINFNNNQKIKFGRMTFKMIYTKTINKLGKNQKKNHKKISQSKNK